MAEIEWHLGVLSWLIFVDLSKWIKLFVQGGVHELVTPLVMGSSTVPEVLWGRSSVEIDGRLYLSKIIYYIIIRGAIR